MMAQRYDTIGHGYTSYRRPDPRIAAQIWSAIGDAARILAEQARKREDKFRDSWEAENKKEDVLNRKFEEALKKVKDQPSERPMRDFDLE